MTLGLSPTHARYLAREPLDRADEVDEAHEFAPGRALRQHQQHPEEHERHRDQRVQHLVGTTHPRPSRWYNAVASAFLTLCTPG